MQLLISQTGNIELLVQHVPQPPGLQVSLATAAAILAALAVCAIAMGDECVSSLMSDGAAGKGARS